MGYMPSISTDPKRRAAQAAAKRRLGHTIKQVRRSRGMKQFEIAQRMGISPGCLSKWENGTVTIPAHMIPALAAALEVEVQMIMGGAYEKNTVSVPDQGRNRGRGAGGHPSEP